MSDTEHPPWSEMRRFLSHIWEPLERDQYVFVGRKDWLGGTTKFEEIPCRVANTDKLLDLMVRKGPDDWYFCPNGFKERKRQRQSASGESSWLYADLDEVDPYGIAADLKPTTAWQTSPGRWQAAWYMEDQALGPRAFERLNKALTYHIGADKGGWSWTKYLRVPGTISNKHTEPFAVTVAWGPEGGPAYAKADLQRHVKGALGPSDPQSGPIHLPDATAPQIVRKYDAVLSARARKLVRAKEIRSGDDRSAKMWDLHKACAEAGMSTGEIVRVVQACVYNKYRGQRREVRALWAEAEKAQAVVAQLQQEVAAAHPAPEPEAIEEAVEAPPLFRPIKLSKYMAQASRDPAWLVNDVWGDGAYGWWAGYEKTFKSTLMIDFALSVASGMPFMGVYDVPRPGPVLVIQEENSEAFMRDKIHRIAVSKALAGELEHDEDNPDNPWVHFPRDPKVWFVNQRRFDLSDTLHMAWLEAWIAEHKPRAVLMDPLYRITAGLNENEGEAMAPILNQVAAISAETNTAMIIAHHFKKPQDGQSSRPTHQLSGAGVMGRWWASAVFSDVVKDEASTITLRFQHREHADPSPIKARLIMDPEDPDDFDVEVGPYHEEEDNPVDLHRSTGKTNQRSGTGKGDAAMRDFLDSMVPGEIMDLSEAAEVQGVTVRAMRSRVQKSESFEMVSATEGAPARFVRNS